MDTLDEIHDANIHTSSTKAEDATLVEVLKWRKMYSNSCIIGNNQMQFNKIMTFASMKGILTKPKA